MVLGLRGFELRVWCRGGVVGRGLRLRVDLYVRFGPRGWDGRYPKYNPCLQSTCSIVDRTFATAREVFPAASSPRHQHSPSSERTMQGLAGPLQDTPRSGLGWYLQSM